MSVDAALSNLQAHNPAGADRVLGADLWNLVRSRGVALTGFSVITTRPSSLLSHASFRLEFADGRVLKGRRVESAAAAGRLLDLRRKIDAPYFPDIVASGGAAFLETWIDGKNLEVLPREPDRFRRCGAILGRLHTSLVVNNGLDKQRAQARKRRNKVMQRIDELRERAAIDGRCARRLGSLIDEFAPDECAIGLIHVDFCAENIVIDESGTPFIVDNETLCVDALYYDLARVWYRWPMRGAERRAFVEGYRSQGQLHEFDSQFPFWAIAAVADGACFRLRNDVPEASVPLRLLERVAKTRWSGASAAARRRRGKDRCYGSFRLGDFVVGVSVHAPADLDWLNEFLAPQFEPGADVAPDFDVIAMADAERLHSVAETIPERPGEEIDCFLRDGDTVRAGRWLDRDDCRLVYDDEIRSIYRVDRTAPRVWLMHEPGTLHPRIGLMRIVRELVMRQCCRSGDMLVHGAALEYDGSGVIIVGPKRAGKTTLLTFLLQDPGTRYISNDRIALVPAGAGAIAVHGIPTIVSVRSDTTAFLPWMRARQQALCFHQRLTIAEARATPVPESSLERMIESPNLTPGQYCALVGTESVAAAPLTTIVFPSPTQEESAASDKGVRVRRLDPRDAARRLRDSLFGPANVMPGGALLNHDGAARSWALPSDEDLLAITSAAACFECVLGPSAYDGRDPAALLREMR